MSRTRRGLAGHPVLPGPGHDLAPLPAVPGLRHGRADPVPGVAGDGRIRSRRTLTVKIPAGVDNGTRIQLAGEGEVGPGGGPPGDLYVEIHELPHSVFQRRGAGLHWTALRRTAAARRLQARWGRWTAWGRARSAPDRGRRVPSPCTGAGSPSARWRPGRAEAVEVMTPSTLVPWQARPLRERASSAVRTSPGSIQAGRGPLLPAEGRVRRPGGRRLSPHRPPGRHRRPVRRSAGRELL
ncbi:Chaperone protein DnaJ [Streptomyces badius]